MTPHDASEFRFAQRVDVDHDGRPFLHYSSHAWLVDDSGAVIRPAFREEGFLRPAPIDDEPDRIELVLAAAAGIVSVFNGLAGDNRWEFLTQGVGYTPTARPISGDRRLYALVASGGAETLAYVQELALEAGDYRPHLQAELRRS